jgi:hypothetical protein
LVPGTELVPRPFLEFFRKTRERSIIVNEKLLNYLVTKGHLTKTQADQFLNKHRETGRSVRELLAQKPAALRWALIFALFLIVLLMGSYGIGYNASNFIYNQF